MQFSVIAAALLGAALAAPHGIDASSGQAIQARQVPVESASMVDASGNIVPFNAATVVTTPKLRKA